MNKIERGKQWVQAVAAEDLLAAAHLDPFEIGLLPKYTSKEVNDARRPKTQTRHSGRSHSGGG